jgi:hypothetical protein
LKKLIEWTEGDNQRARKIVIFGTFFLFFIATFFIFALAFFGIELSNINGYYVTLSGVVTASIGAHMAFKPSSNSSKSLLP